MSNSHMSYKRIGKRCRGSKGFRLKIPTRFWVQGLRTRFFYMFRILSRWRSSYGRALRLVIKKMGVYNGSRNLMKRNNSSGRAGSRAVVENQTPKEIAGQPNSCGKLRMRSSLRRSNSFYSEAIADCLEFIKRSSLPVDQKQPLEPVPLDFCQ